MRWKARQSRLTNNQYEVLKALALHRPGVFKPLDSRLARAADLMIQGVHPWLKTMADPKGTGTTLYTITSDGRAKYVVAKRQRD